MQEPQQLIRIRHIPKIRVPSCILEAVGETSNHEDEDEHRVGWVQRDPDICGNVAGGPDDGDATLAEVDVDGIIQKGGEEVADEGREED